MTATILEIAFWTMIMGDHLRLFKCTLEAKEQEYFQRVVSLENQSNEIYLSALQGNNTLSQAMGLSREVRQVKTTFIQELIAGKIGLNMDPTFINHMLNELDEADKVFEEIQQTGTIKPKHPLNYHFLWLKDGAGHADGIYCGLDATEEDLRKRAKECKKKFHHLFNQTEEYVGYLRTGLANFPRLGRLTTEADFEMKVFISLLDELSKMVKDRTALGHIPPIMIDHMLREEYYYLSKIAAWSGTDISALKSPLRTPEELAQLSV